jgi:nitrite reductase/ring-hydroxylating ferredoxin subunit
LTAKTNLYIFLFLISILLVFTSCQKEKNDVIPDVYIDFYISLSDPQFFDLTAPLNFEYVSSATNNMGDRAAGYDNNGIIIFRAQENEFFAYDRTCPYDYFVNGKSIKVNGVDMIYAVCPDCGTKYALPNYGTPLSGFVGRYPLKNYKTAFDGLNVHVWNY